MDAMFAQMDFDSNLHLNKRRRFVPAPESYCAPGGLGNEFNQNKGADGPFLLQLIGRTPSQQEIEAELLQVGMRIRKSVSESHKTTAFTPRPFFNMRRLSPATQAALSSGTLNRQPISTATFCGINLTALAHISSTPVEPPRMWSYSTSHKRAHDGDSDSDDQDFMPQTPTLTGDDESTAFPVDYFDIDFDTDGDISPTTQPAQMAAPHLSGRRLAQPKSRRSRQIPPSPQTSSNPFAQLQIPHQINGVRWMGHRRIASCGLEAKMSIDDLGGAMFLQRREDVEMDCS